MGRLINKRAGDDAPDVYSMIFKIKDDDHSLENNVAGIGAEQGLNVFINTDGIDSTGKREDDCLQIFYVTGGCIRHFQFVFDISFQFCNILFCFGRNNNLLFHNVRKSTP